MGAGCGHAVATQTPRPWEVQAGAARPLLSGLRPPQAGHVGAASALPGSLHEGPQRPLLHLLFPLETTHPQPAQCLPSGTFHRRLLLSPPDLPPDSHPPPPRPACRPGCVQGGGPWAHASLGGGRGETSFGSDVVPPPVPWVCPCVAPEPALSSLRPAGGRLLVLALQWRLGAARCRRFPSWRPSWGQIPCVVCAVYFSLSPSCLFHFLALPLTLHLCPHLWGWQTLLCGPGDPPVAPAAHRFCLPPRSPHMPVLRPGVAAAGQAVSRPLCVPGGPAARGWGMGLFLVHMHPRHERQPSVS